MVEAIRSALREVDRDPRRPAPYLDLIDAYLRGATQEGEPELLEQAGFVIRDVKRLPLEEADRRRLADLEAKVAACEAALRGPRSTG